MERQGTASIFKVSATLLHKHYRLFLANFVLANNHLILIVIVYLTLTPPPSSTPLHDASVDKDSVNTAQTTDPPYKFVYSVISPWALYCMIDIMSFFTELEAKRNATQSAVADSQNTPTPTGEDRSITPKDSRFPFNIVPLRTFIIEFYIMLAFFFHSLLFVTIGGLLEAIIFATAGLADPKLFFSYALLPVLFYITEYAVGVALLQAILVPVHWSRETTEEKR